MGDVSVPMDWQPGDAVVIIHKPYGGHVGIIIRIMAYENYPNCAMVYVPRGIDFINLNSLAPAFL